LKVNLKIVEKFDGLSKYITIRINDSKTAKIPIFPLIYIEAVIIIYFNFKL
jgi:hypothetical protein